MIGIDCADPRALAEFYSQLLGWSVLSSDDEFAMLEGEGVPFVFWRIDDHRPPRWPDPDSPKQFHLDLRVDDLDEAEALCLRLGGSKPEFQPGEHWRVLLDPAGHPFCITIAT